MKKAMEFWIFREDIKLMNLHHHVIGPNGVHLKEDSTALERPEEWIHVKEVLDPDPKDEVIKIMREAIKISIESRCEGCGLTEINCDLAEALSAVEKLEK